MEIRKSVYYTVKVGVVDDSPEYKFNPTPVNCFEVKDGQGIDVIVYKKFFLFEQAEKAIKNLETAAITNVEVLAFLGDRQISIEEALKIERN